MTAPVALMVGLLAAAAFGIAFALPWWAFLLVLAFVVGSLCWLSTRLV